MAFPGFDRSFFAFFTALKANNTREWFADHKTDYQRDVEAPALEFIAEVAPRLKTISPRFVADRPPAFLDRYVETCVQIAPLMKFLTAALGQRW